jgi:hypothetical protein
VRGFVSTPRHPAAPARTLDERGLTSARSDRRVLIRPPVHGSREPAGGALSARRPADIVVSHGAGRSWLARRRRPLRGASAGRRASGAVSACASVCAIRPDAAVAHVSPGLISSSFEARVSGITPRAPGIGATVLDGDQRLRLTVAPGHGVVVLGIIGEPFLRFGPSGVFAWSRSPTAGNAKVIDASQAAGAPHWIRVSTGASFTWHENRLRPVLHPSHSGAVGTWRIPLVVDGRRSVLRGTEWYGAPPPRLPWAIGGLALLAAVGAAGALRPGRRTDRVGSVAAIAAATAWSAGWIGVLLYQRTTAIWLGVSAAYAISVALLVAAALAEPDTRRTRLLIAGAIGVLAATFSLPEIGVFERHFVFSALPADAARACVIIGLGAGAGAAIFAAIAARREVSAARRPPDG